MRALRAYIGANSGPYTGRQHVFYEQREVITTYLRVHAIPGVMDFFDYSAAATGMTYRNDRNTAGVRVDGVPDAPALGSLAWESVDGPQGGLTSVHRYDTDIPGFATTSYYLDQRTPTGTAERQCTGDAAAYGASGPRIAQAIPNTDPRSQPANRLDGHARPVLHRPGLVRRPASRRAGGDAAGRQRRRCGLTTGTARGWPGPRPGTVTATDPTKGRDMAKKSNTDLVDRLHAGGLRKRVASSVADAIGSGGSRKQPPKAVSSVITQLRSLTDEIEDRATGRTAKRKAAARKGAATRRKNAAKRSGTAKKAARTRAKKR